MAGFRDKDSQLVPEADPPPGQSSSGDLSAHGREVPDENRNVKSKAGSGARADKCANCSFDFTTPTPGRAKVADVVVPSEVSPGLTVGAPGQTVKVREAFEYVFNVKADDGQGDVSVCSDCAQFLAGVYGLVSKLSQLRTADSYFARRIEHQQDLISTFKTVGKGASVKKGKNSRPAPKGTQYKAKKEKVVKTVVSRPSPVRAAPKKASQSRGKKKPPPQDAPASAFNFQQDSIDARPSRASKLTAMVLMNNTLDTLPTPAKMPTVSRSVQSTPASSRAAKKPAAGKQPQRRKKKADESATITPAKKAKLSVEPSIVVPIPGKSRGKKSVVPEVPSTPAVSSSVTKTPKSKTPRSETRNTSRANKSATSKKAGAKLGKSAEAAGSSSSAPAAKETKKGQKRGKGKGKSLEEAVEASKLGAELKIPEVPVPTIALGNNKLSKKAKKDKGGKKLKIMISKATSTKRNLQSDEDSAVEVSPAPAAAKEKKGDKKKRGKKSTGEAGAGGSGDQVLDLSLKIPQVPIPKAAGSGAEKALTKSKKKAVKKSIIAGSVTEVSATPLPLTEQKQKQKKSKAAIKGVNSVAVATKEEIPSLAPKKGKKVGKKSEESLTQAKSSKGGGVGGGVVVLGSLDNKAGTKAAYVCTACGKDFTARWNLRRHDLLVHELSTTPPFTCSICNAEFPARKVLLEHRMSGPCANANGPAQDARPVVNLSPPKPEPASSKKASKKESKVSEKVEVKKEKQERKRKVDGDEKAKPAKKVKKTVETASVGIDPKEGENIPKNVMSGIEVAGKSSLVAVAQSAATTTGSVPGQNGPIETAVIPQEIDSAETKSGDGGVGTSSNAASSVNHAEPVTSTPAGGDTAGVGA